MFSRSRTMSVRMISILFVATSLVLAGCGKSAKKTETRLARTSSDTSGLQGGADGWGPGRAPSESEMGDGTGVARGGASITGRDGSGSLLNDGSMNGVENGKISGELGMVHFAYDSTEITEDWKQVLNGHAQWIAGHPTVNIQVEGHCDERGTEEYNISLGQRRADAVRSYLIEQGADGKRITTISYGKMRPMEFQDTEESHALNRRAMFMVFEGTNQVASGPADPSAEF